MKILILYIYSDSPIYNKMLELQREYIINSNSNINFSCYFIQFRNKQINNVEIENDFIYVKGEEKLLNITIKTLKSLSFLLKDLGLVYDFVIRTNISTIINFNKLLNFLQNLPKNNIYCTGKILKVQQIDTKYGITNYKYFGTYYASGTSIILSYDIACIMINNIHKFNHNIIDDVSIAIFIKIYLPEAYKNLSLYTASFLVSQDNMDFSKINKYIFIRNKYIPCNKHIIFNRNNDIENIKKVIKTILYSV